LLWGSGANNCRAKMDRVKEGGGGGEERKEMLADKPRILKTAHTHNDFILSLAVINKPLKSSAFCSGSEL